MTRLGKYLTLEEFCTCTETYCRYADNIEPYPQNPRSIEAIEELCRLIIDPIIDNFGRENFQLTYGFCSPKLKYFLEKKDPISGIKNGRIAPEIDQHMAWEVNSKGNYYCQRLGAACDFQILQVDSYTIVKWIVDRQLPFDSLYYYKVDRPIHISYGSEQKRAMWTFSPTGQPLKLVL